MLTFDNLAAQSNCRTFVLPTCDTTQSATASTIPAAAAFQLRQRDALDFTIDVQQWLASYGDGAKLTGATWAIAGTTDSTGVTATRPPTIVGSGFDPSGLTLAVVKPNAAAVVGDVYTLDVELTIGASTVPSTTISVPERTVTRRIQLIVVAG